MTNNIVVYPDETEQHINHWATTALTSDELLNFQESKKKHDALWETFIERIDQIHETVHSTNLNANIRACVGFTLVLKDNVTREYTDTHGISAEWDYWSKRYATETT